MRVCRLALVWLCTAQMAVVLGEDGDRASLGFLDRFSFSGLFYLAYEYEDIDDKNQNDFFINRAYLTTKVKILPFLSGRITYDVTQDKEGDGTGDMEVRLKYAFAKFDLGDWGYLHGVNMEAGIVHMVWLDFEEHIDLYRMRDPMFIERSGVFNSADFGLTVAGNIGPKLPESYRKKVNSKYAGRYGSFAVGIYNGGGYHGQENNDDKVKEGRITVRPAPDALPGLQASVLGIVGKGNQSGPRETLPDWKTFSGMLSYESERIVITFQSMSGKGNQKGTWTEPDDASQATDFDGYAAFGEWRCGPKWRLIGGYDRFNRESMVSDYSFDRGFIGMGYDLGRKNIILLDYDQQHFDDESKGTHAHIQLTLQLKF